MMIQNDKKQESHLLALLILFTLGLSSMALAASETPQTFPSTKAALQAVLAACKQNDTSALLAIFGPEGKDIVESGDSKQDADGRAEFLRVAQQKNKFVSDPKNSDRMILVIGKDHWPFPVPLVRKDGRWSFDSSQGRQEILARRIGSNELNAIEVGHGFVEAEFEYAQDHRQNGIPQYTGKIVSTPGKQDGLYWEAGKGQPECDVPKGFAKAAASMAADQREPYRGYYYRILTSQGPKARGGAMNYIVNNLMIGGFALVAWPAEYGVSGIQTFIVNHDGIVYQADLGPETGRAAAEMTEFNPDKAWQPVQP